MKRLKLKNSDKTALLDADDYSRINQYEWLLKSDSRCSNLYVVRYKNFKAILLHRVIMRPDVNVQIDHKNGDGLDNRKINLRECTHIQNRFNRKIHKNNKCGYKGVYWQEYPQRKWRVTIYKEKKKIHVGYFDDLIEAAKAYNEAAIEYHGEFARLNII